MNDAVRIRAGKPAGVLLIVKVVFFGHESARVPFEGLLARKAEQQRDQRHPDRHAEGGLPEIGGPPVAVERNIQFAHPRQRMQQARLRELLVLEKTLVDGRIFLRLSRPAFLLETRDIHRVDVLARFDLRVGNERKLMRLVGRHVQNVDRGIVLFVIGAGHGEAVQLIAQPPMHMFGQFHTLGRHQHDVRAEARQRINEGMDRPAALQIAGNRDIQMLEVLALLQQREQIAQRLGRMLMRAVAGIHHRHIGVAGGELGRAVARMTDHQQVRIIGCNPDRIGQTSRLWPPNWSQDRRC